MRANRSGVCYCLTFPGWTPSSSRLRSQRAKRAFPREHPSSFGGSRLKDIVRRHKKPQTLKSLLCAFCGLCALWLSDVQVSHIQRVVFDELASRLDGVAHQDGKDFVRLDSVIDPDFQ